MFNDRQTTFPKWPGQRILRTKSNPPNGQSRLEYCVKHICGKEFINDIGYGVV